MGHVPMTYNPQTLVKICLDFHYIPCHLYTTKLEWNASEHTNTHVYMLCEKLLDI